MSKKTIQTPKLQMRAAVQGNSFNEDDNTVEIVWSTGAPGRRWSWDGPFMEELSMKKSHIRLERLNQGAPVLNNHRSYDLGSNIGVVEKAWIKNGQGHAIVRLSKREEIAGIVQDIKDNVIRNISVGYVIHKLEDVTKKNDEIPTYRATDWEPMELSFVNIPFDKDAQVRSMEDNKEAEKFETLIIRSEEQEMAEKIQEPETKVTPEKETEERELETDPEKTVEKNQQPKENEKEERNVKAENQTKSEVKPETKQENKMNERELEKTRQIEIRKACKASGLDEDFAEKMITDDTALDAARGLIINELAKRNEKAPTKNQKVEVNDVDNRQLRCEAATNALIHKATDGKVELKDDARQYRGMNLVRLAEEIMTSGGQSVRGLSNNEIAERALHSSDFSAILSNVANKSLRMGYDEQPQTFESFVRSTSVSDFKEISRTQISDAPGLEEVNESGEYKHGILKDSAEKYRVKTYGKIVAITRQTLVNDDLDAFARLPMMYGRRSRDLETILVYKEITSNPVMADGKTLFHADHGNLAAAGAVISVASVGAARLAMRLQKGLNDELVRIKPSNILVPAALETDLDKFLADIRPTKDSDVNPLKSLGGISEAELDAISQAAWYVLSDKNQLDMIEIARLDGQGPRLSSKEGFESDAVKFKVSYDFGVKVLDHRGFYKNPGA